MRTPQSNTEQALREKDQQSGATLIESVLTVLLLSLTIAAWFKVYQVVTEGMINSKTNLRAQNLALSKMEQVKNITTNYSNAGLFAKVTLAADVSAFGITQVASLENKSFTWRVLTSYASNVSSGAYVTGSAATNAILLQSSVWWVANRGPSGITLTSLITDMR